ncbi:MAG TPA: hypothetical protein VJZ77_09370 [Blastocatellia bacterium]|nr:hypothetical protein [Blastocatellia bacterium]
MATIKIEGQTIKGDAVGITDEIANDDDLLKAALAPTWPDVRTATINRSGGKDGKELVVTVQKKAGTKGALIERLLAAPAGVNPAVEMSRRIQELARAGEIDPGRVKEMLPEIERAADTGERDLDAARAAFRDLREAGAAASKEVPFGF